MRVRERAEGVVLELEVGQRVARVRVEPAGDDQQLRREAAPPPAAPRRRSAAGRRPAPCPAAAARSASCRPRRRARLVRLARHRPERVLVQRDGEHARVLVEHRLRAVAVVHVPVDDRDAADAVHRLRAPRPRSTRWPAGRSPWRGPAPRGGPGGRSSVRAGRAAEGQPPPPATAPPAASSAACQESGAVYVSASMRAPTAQASMQRVEVRRPDARARRSSRVGLSRSCPRHLHAARLDTPCNGRQRAAPGAPDGPCDACRSVPGWVSTVGITTSCPPGRKIIRRVTCNSRNAA